MRLALITPALLLVAGIGTAAAQQSPPRTAPRPVAPPILKLMAPAFGDGGQLPGKYNCQNDRLGAGVSPALRWSNVPKGTASFVLVMHGPDNHPAKGMLDDVLWVLWNLPATSTQLPEGLPATPQLPDGSRQGTVRGDVAGYRAPCPPPGSGPHHYLFELYAIDRQLDVTPQASRDDVLKAADGHIIGASALVGIVDP